MSKTEDNQNDIPIQNDPERRKLNPASDNMQSSNSDNLFSDVRCLIQLMKENNLSVMEVEKGDFKIVLKTGANIENYPLIATPASPSHHLSNKTISPSETVEILDKTVSINSPMVGSFYVATSPETPPLVSIGCEVQPDTVVCIIEAMKVMNEIRADISGKIVEIVAENGKPVQFGQPLFRCIPTSS